MYKVRPEPLTRDRSTGKNGSGSLEFDGADSFRPTRGRKSLKRNPDDIPIILDNADICEMYGHDNERDYKNEISSLHKLWLPKWHWAPITRSIIIDFPKKRKIKVPRKSTEMTAQLPI